MLSGGRCAPLPDTDVRDERLQIMLSPEELTCLTISGSSIGCRAAAVRELLRLGLSVDPTDGDGQKSSHYGVFNRGSDGHREEA